MGRLDETEVYFQLSRTHGLVEWRKKNTKWKFHKFANLTVIAASLKDELMGCNVLPEILPKKHPMNCPTYDESTSQPHNDSLSLFGLFFSNCTENESWKKRKQFVCSSIEFMKLEVISSMEFTRTIFQLLMISYLNISMYDINIANANNIGGRICATMWADKRKYCKTTETQPPYRVCEQH